MKAALLLPVLAGKDAVGNDTLAMAALLRERGIDTRVFCDVAHGVAETTYAPDTLPDFAGGPDDLVIYHFSTGWPRALDLLGKVRGYRVVRYHNITPPEFFAGSSKIYESACAKGREEIPAVAGLGCERYLAASHYNLDELIANGTPAARGAVLAPFHRVQALLDAEADLALLDELNDGARNLLMVGRVAPNKNHVALIDAFAAYVDAYGDPARLLIVGRSDPGLDAYNQAIRARIEAHRLGDRVWWLDALSEAQLKSAYLASHAFLTMSRHEGFCVPLIEAMALGVPVLAHASSAIPETVAGGGVVWAEEDPWLYAASLARLGGDAAFRNDLRDAARLRYEREFAPAVLRERFFRALEPLS
ncbi:glycosyltransferase family 4 protein [Dokdonella sp.]|uniref:glycosyltransferase family 4 protein n=1 Tax=Dokdonella sp. TaxID=2291710 RepID=UPI001B0FEAAE|nr:glycosyltransferase family 4 protein [Dokdonella sp.]MBO9661404.1 glycosyltransferase family 4 protein [Dokdonella sp.]